MSVLVLYNSNRPVKFIFNFKWSLAVNRVLFSTTVKVSSVTRHQHSTLDSRCLASNLKLHHLDKVPAHRCRKNVGGQETSPLTLLLSLCPNYLLVLLTDDDDDDNDVDE